MSGSPSLAARSLLAVLLMIGFYLLALTVSAVLLWIPIAEYQLAHRVHLQILIACWLGAVIILWSIVPRPDRFEPPGPRLEPGRQPRLFDELEGIARATGQAMPAEVYLVPDVNAWVAGRGGAMGFGSRRVMGLGLPLMQALSVSELRAVLAHEFGHYHAGDTRLGPWVHKTRATIGRTLAGLEEHSGLIQKPFAWYGAMFLRVTHAVSRAQEFAADALAARVAGAAALQSGLRRLHGAGAAFPNYWSVEVLPLLQMGFRPPLAEGFSRFSARPGIASAMEACVNDALREQKTDPYDTHPAMAERIAAVEGIGAGAAAPDPRPAVVLLDDVPAVERELLATLAAATPEAPPLQPVSWDEVGERAVRPDWEEMVRKHAGLLSTLTVEQLPATVRALDAFATRIEGLPDALPGVKRRQFALWLLGVALGVLLTRQGGVLRSLPGEPVLVIGPGGEIDPVALVAALNDERPGGERWDDRMARLGIAGRALAEAPG